MKLHIRKKHRSVVRPAARNLVSTDDREVVEEEIGSEDLTTNARGDDDNENLGRGRSEEGHRGRPNKFLAVLYALDGEEGIRVTMDAIATARQ